MATLATATRTRRRPGAGVGADVAERRCIASGEVRPKDELLRFVVGPEDSLVFDLSGKLPGRGIWLSPRRDMIEKARDRNLFARAAKTAVKVPDDLLARIERSLHRRCLDQVGLARRAGQAVAGFEKVRSLLTADQARLLIHAVDAAADGKGKLGRLARASAARIEILELFSAAELGRAFGRDAAVHVALRPGGIAERLGADAARLSGVRGAAQGRLDCNT